MKLFIFVLFSTSVFIQAQEFDIEYPDDWVDPSDMINFKYEAREEKENLVDNDKSETLKPERLETKKKQDNDPPPQKGNEKEPPPTPVPENTETTHKDIEKKAAEAENFGSNKCKNPFLQRFVTVLHHRLNLVGHPPIVSDFELDLHLDSRSWLALQEFADECGSNVAEITEILESMLKTVRLQSKARESRLKLKFENFIRMPLEDLIKFGLMILFLLMFLTLEGVSRISWASQLRRLVILAFLVSIPLTYIHELKLAEAEHKAKAIDIPEECKGLDKQESYWGNMKTLYNNMFSVSNDPCVEYHANYLISPHIKVTPVKVLAVTFTKFAVEPLEHIGTAFSKAFKNIFAGLPVTLWIPAFLFVVLVILGFLLIVAVCFGYTFSFNLPFWAGLQMGPQQGVQPHPQMDQILADNRQHIEHLHATIQELRTRPQQALPAPPPPSPPVLEQGARTILSLFGFRGAPPPRPPAPSPPPYPAEQPEGDCPYPVIPQHELEPQISRGQAPFYPTPSASGDQLPTKDGVRRRKGVNPRSQDQAMEMPYANSQTQVKSPRIQAEDGRNPIGFEHLLVENVQEDQEDYASDLNIGTELRRNMRNLKPPEVDAMPPSSDYESLELRNVTSDKLKCGEQKDKGDIPTHQRVEDISNDNDGASAYEHTNSSVIFVKEQICSETLAVEDIQLNDHDSSGGAAESGWVSVTHSCGDMKCDGKCEDLNPQQLMNAFQHEAEEGISFASHE